MISVGPPGVRVTFTKEEIARFAKRFRRNPLYRGPCLIVERESGRALDSTPQPKVGTHPLLWTVHGLPWQRWFLHSAGSGLVTIVSEPGTLALGADGAPRDGGPVTLQTPTGVPNQLWRLLPTDDGSAFLIESVVSAHALDATNSPQNRTSPFLWGSHWKPWQQWVIARLPLT